MSQKVTFDPAAKITVVVKQNPYKAGTKAFDTYEFFGQCKTVGDFRFATAGNPMVDPGYLRYSSRDGFITVEPNPYGAAMKPAKRGPNFKPAAATATAVQPVAKPRRAPLTKVQFAELKPAVQVSQPVKRAVGRRKADKVAGALVKAVAATRPAEQVL